MKIIEDRVSFLDGFLQGISEIDGKIREFKILAWFMDFDQDRTVYDNFITLFDGELHVASFEEKKISFKQFEKELIENILINPFDKGFIDLERKKYIAFRIMDYLKDSIQEFNYNDISILDVKISFIEEGLNRYFLLPVADKALFILFRAPNKIA